MKGLSRATRLLGAYFLLAAIIAKSEAYAAPQDYGCFPGPATVFGGFLSGAECSKMSNAELSMLMMGFANGLLSANLLGAPESCVKKYDECLTEKTGGQLAAIFAKYSKKNPEQWHLPCNVLAFLSIHKMCNGLGYFK